MKDVQSEKDHRGVYLNRVGIEDLRIPIVLKNPDGGQSHTVAEVLLAVDLDENERGTHMSRFVEVINEINVLKPHEIRVILEHLTKRLDAKAAFLEMDFPYFIMRKAPISGIESTLDIDCTIRTELKGDEFAFYLTVSVPFTTLCPCSKEISQYGAHNQRAVAMITVKTTALIWIEDIVSIVEKNSSSPIYSLLKRSDEKFITERAYENPKFVEDMTRDIYNDLDKIEELDYFEVYVKSFESIHNHNAFARAYKER